VKYVQRVKRIGYLARTYWLDLVVALLALGAMFEVAVRQDAENAPRTTWWFVIPALAALAFPVFARRHHPFGAAAAFWLLAAAISFVDGRLIPFPAGVFLLGMAASFLLGNLRDTRHAWIGLTITLGGATIVVYNQPSAAASSFVFIPILFGISWLAGFALHSREEQAEVAEARAEQAEHDREVAARIAVAEERARIARELHDVVAHSVSVMVLQVGAVRHKLPEALEDEEEVLRGVERTGRAALAEMRHLLGAMRRHEDDLELGPQPGLDALDSLMEEVGRAGLPVHLHVEGIAFPLPRAVDLSAYRIVQEGLTNVLKHAHAGAADVTVRYAPDELRIEVRDDGQGSAASDGLGHGLVGIRERVKIYGGEMSAGRAPDGGFILSTRLPVRDNGS
jgi:signal transduction histidine kinase